jgi:hypothetical protein
VLCEVFGKPDAGGISAGQRRSAILPRLLAEPFELLLESKIGANKWDIHSLR